MSPAPSMTPRRSLKYTLILRFSGFVALALVIITFCVTYLMHREMQHQAHLMLNESAHASRIQIETQLSYLVEATQRLADNPVMVNGLVDSQARNRDLPKLIGHFAQEPSLRSVALLDFGGRPLFKTEQWLPSFQDTPALRQALAQNDTTLYLDMAAQQLFIIAPVTYYKTSQGALVAGFDLLAIASRHTPHNNKAYLQLLGQGSPQVTVNRQPQQTYIARRAFAQTDTPHLNQLRLTVEVGIPKSQFDQVITDTLSKFMAIGIVLTLVAAAVAAIIGRSIARPVLELLRRTRADPPQPCSPLDTEDELDALASAFDQRTAELEEAKTELQAQRDRFHYEANHDALTGLPNRSNFNKQLPRFISQCRRTGQTLAVAFIDLDRFKLINDSLGHATGDLVLQQVAQRLQQPLRKGDYLYRHGGDEFILVAFHEQPQEASQLLECLLQALSSPVTMGEHDLDIRASIGVTLSPQDGTDSVSLIRNADIAMYRAKQKGGFQYHFFNHEMSDQAYQRLDIEMGLRRAIEKRELVAFYQPQIDMSTGRFIGTEALVRWEHPDRGMIFPGVFIPIAEESRLIIDIGEYMLREACCQQAAWYRAGLNPGRVSVNLAGPQIKSPVLLSVIRQTLADTGCRAEWLELEVTENFIMDDPTNSIPTLKALGDMGIRLAIDDFGTGRSSLAYLKRLPVDRLKIDQSFVRHASQDPKDAAVIEVIIALGHNFRMEVIAEGVETDTDRQLLIKAGCNLAQGYLYSRPLPAAQLEQQLQNYHQQGQLWPIAT